MIEFVNAAFAVAIGVATVVTALCIVTGRKNITF